jgi:hypothetical protein
MYVSPDFPTKAALKRAVAAGDEVTVFPPGLGKAPDNGTVSVEGPHAPKPHTWYARVTVKDGLVVTVK